MWNQAIILGHLSNDPEVSISDDGGKAITLNVAEVKDWDDAADMQSNDTSWHRVVIRGSNAEIAEKHLKKGSKVYIKGFLKDYEVEGFIASKIIATEIKLLSDIDDAEQKTLKEHEFNKVELIGSLIDAPSAKIIGDSGNLKQGLLSIVVNDSWVNHKGERCERRYVNTAILNDDQARSAEKYLDKNTKLFIKGTMKTLKYNDSKGNEHYKNNILPLKITILGGEHGTK